MKTKKIFTLLTLFLLILSAGCEREEFDKVLRNQERQKMKIDDIDARIKALEDLVNATNSEIKTISSLIDATEKKITITSYVELPDKSGYELTMSDGTKLILKNGTAGSKGEKGDKGDQGDKGNQGDKGEKGEQGDKGNQGDKGEKGEQGNKGNQGEKGEQGEQGDKGEKGEQGEQGDKDEGGEDGEEDEWGVIPVINVKLHSDGRLYWTLNDEWMLDAQGEMICAQGIDGDDGEKGDDGKDGKDGKNPIMRVNSNGEWEVSLDGGTMWQAVKGADGNPIKAEGERGDKGEKGKDGTPGADGDLNLSITETDDSIIIEYKGVTYTIQKGSEESTP